MKQRLESTASEVICPIPSFWGIFCSIFAKVLIICGKKVQLRISSWCWWTDLDLWGCKIIYWLNIQYRRLTKQTLQLHLTPFWHCDRHSTIYTLTWQTRLSLSTIPNGYTCAIILVYGCLNGCVCVFVCLSHMCDACAPECAALLMLTFGIKVCPIRITFETHYQQSARVYRNRRQRRTADLPIIGMGSA